MADFIEVAMIVFELIWTLIKMTVENIRCIIRTFVPPEPKDIHGEITLITGAGHGMGREMALRFAKLGAIVVCVDINAKGNEETVQAIKDNGGKAHRYECDVTDRAAVFSLAERVTKEVGEVTILVNNAGIMPSKPILEWTEQKIRSTIDVNITTNLWMIQAFLPAMKKRNHGHIVAMSSMAGLIGIKNLVPYCGTKFAVRGIMEALENELHDESEGKSNIKFTTICPYMVNTGLCKNTSIRFQSLMKMMEPGEAADMIIDAVRKNVYEVTLPHSMHYGNRFLGRLISPSAARITHKFFGVTVEPHD
ncbi:17-beta-hydroxysteroid dehydrogenase 13-like [Leguminivora glycinivorella]|uniref:17-beta-hydroxysteroid dehydrogenase 13-like n=1 Tax=Leguminivora glycinivorella TaxID=1035111 RepID=UPI00201059BF|nr:17-beta-hydroxysteroid dehydrogenase 13-like [Leguminivora glycinivorella]